MANIIGNVMVGTGILYYHTTPGTASASVTTEFGYTEDGVTLEYAPTTSDIDVEEETFSIERVLTKEEFTITANLAETRLANLQNAMAGALTGGANIVDLGGGALQDMALRFVGTAPSGFSTRTFYVPYAHPTGTVGMPYKKGEKTLIPVQFKAYKGAAGDVVVITDTV